MKPDNTGPNTGPDTDAGPDTAEVIPYGEAVTELESILAELEGDIDIDLLGDKVRRAAVLIAACRERIHRAEIEVERIVADLADETED